MKIQIYSDLHLENCKIYPQIKPYCDVLILAGDIGKINSLNFYNFMEYCSKNWKYVLYIKGNHECYDEDFETVDSTIIKLLLNFTNIFYLNNSSKVIDGYEFIGSVFWTLTTNRIPIYINDFNKINNFTYDTYCDNHNKDLKYLTEQLNKKSNYKKVFITHFPPILKNTSNPIYKNELTLIKKYFANNISNELLNLSNFWIFGHTHWSCDFFINNTRLISNAKGYDSSEYYNFKSDGIFEIP